MSKVNIFDLCRTISQEENANVSEVTAKEADNHETDIKVLMNDAIEQAEEQDEEENVKVKNENDNQLATSMEELDVIEDELVEQHDEVESGYEDLETIEETAATLEAYKELLDGMAAKRYEVSKETARAINIGLESMDKEFFKGVVISVEDAEEGENSAEKTGNKVGEKIKNFIEAGKKLFAKLMEMAKNAFNFIFSNTKKLKETLEAVEEKIKGSSYSEASYEFNKVPALITADGKTVLQAQDYKDLADALRVIRVDIPNAYVSAAKNLVRELEPYADELSKGQTDELTKKLTDKIDSIKQQFAESSVFTMDGVRVNSKSKPLLGGTAIKVSTAESSSFRMFIASYGYMGRLANWEMTQVDDIDLVNEVKGNIEKNEMLKVAEQIHAVIYQLDTFKEYQDTIQRVAKEFANTSQESVIKHWGDHLVKNAAKDCVKMNVQMTGHAFRVAKAGINLLNQVANNLANDAGQNEGA